MCGIFGYVGKKDNSSEIVLDGLKLLEYRGYDSWGVAVKVGNKIIMEKHVGKIGSAVSKLPKSNIGIGHTRWATHGGVTQINAHPHLDCSQQIAVLHNGIIENFEEIKTDLIKKGHKFISETDTEVVPHLIEEYLKSKPFIIAVQLAFKRLQGMNAFVVLHSPTAEIVTAKTGSPLAIGVGKDEFFVASDAIGILKHTREIIFLEDNQMAILGQTLRLIDLNDGKGIKPQINHIDWKFEEADRGKFKHFLLKEIFDQPQVIKNIALNSKDGVRELSSLISSAYGTFMLGCGTASHAALAGIYIFSNIAKKHVNFSIGSEFNYLEDYLTNRSLVVPISQSGETIDVVEPVSEAKKRGARIAAIVNVLGSTLYRQADFKLLLNAGPEKAVVSTKAFTAMISVLFYTAYTLAKKEKEGMELLLKTSENVKQLLTDSSLKKVKKVAKILKNKEHIYVIGRGPSYATALEVTLKIKETSYTHAEGFAGGELKHGVIALIEKGTPCIVLAPNDHTYDDIISNSQEIKARGGFIIGIGPRNNKVFDVFLETADVKEATLIPQVVIGQLLGYYLALEKGIVDPDKPRNLAKSVTVK